MVAYYVLSFEPGLRRRAANEQHDEQARHMSDHVATSYVVFFTFGG